MRSALIIANTEYTDPGLAQLTAPGKDAEDFARVLKSADIAGFDNVITLMNENISKVNETVDDFFALKKPDDLLVFYFSGHGVRDEYGELYLAIKNTNRARLRSTAIRADYIRESMDQSRSRRQVLILDCCNSGAFAQGTKAETGGTMGTATTFEGTGYGRVVLTASDATQFAWEGDKVIGESSNSLFTHYLVKGLEGEADQDGDGKITVDELYDYAYEQIVNITPKQTPGKWSYKQQGEIVLRQSTSMENIKPVSLPDQLTSEIENPYPEVRLRAVGQLAKLLSGKNLGLARSAREVLEKIAADDDSRRVAQAALQALEFIRQAEQLAAQRAQEEKQVREQTKLLAAQKAEEEHIAHEREEEKRKAREELERRVREKVETEWKAQEEAKHLAAQKVEEERLAQENQLAAEKAEAERVAREKAELERLAQEKAESERLAAKRAEEERIAQEKIVRERLARQKAEREAAKREAAELAAHEAAEKAEQKAARRKIERESAEKAIVTPRKTASPQPALRRQPILKWIIIGIMGLCVIATGAWGMSYLASLGPLVPIGETQTKTPATAVPTTKEIATVPTGTRRPTQTPTPTLTPLPIVMELYDDFNNKAYDGNYESYHFDSKKWGFGPDPGVTTAQQDGVLKLAADTGVCGASGCGGGVTLVGGTTNVAERTLSLTNAIEAKMSLANEFSGSWFSIILKVYAVLPYYWHYICIMGESSSEAYFECVDSNNTRMHFSKRIPITRNQYYTVRIEVDPSTATFRSYLNNQLVDIYEPSNAAELKKSKFIFLVLTGANSNTTGSAFVDEIRLGKPASP